MNVSVAIATYNEEENIIDCLKTVRQLADEMVVVDGGSTDRTRQLARKFGAKVIKTDNPSIFHINKQMAINQCRGDWILQLDADERVSDGLRREIAMVIGVHNNYAAYYLPRKNYFLGHWLKKGGQYPDYVIRLFRRGRARLPCKSVHEQMKVNGEVGYLKNDLLHYSYPSFREYLRKTNIYTTLTADEFAVQKLPGNFMTTLRYIMLMPLKQFLLIYFRHLGFLDGFPGFVFAFFSGLHYFIAYIKYWEKR